LYYDVEVKPEEEEKFIEETAQRIHKYGIETVAILFIESYKPLAYLGGQIGRFFLSPYLPIVSDKWGENSERFFLTFEKRENIDKLIKRLEELVANNNKDSQPEKTKENLQGGSSNETSTTESSPQDMTETRKKKGWRNYLHL
jgi:hypothetical protein